MWLLQATDGAVRKLFGYQDSVSNGTMEAKFVERKHAYKNHYTYTLYDENENMIVQARLKEDIPIWTGCWRSCPSWMPPMSASGT